jgi:hypothetical protein
MPSNPLQVGANRCHLFRQTVVISSFPAWSLPAQRVETRQILTLPCSFRWLQFAAALANSLSGNAFKAARVRSAPRRNYWA